MCVLLITIPDMWCNYAHTGIVSTIWRVIQKSFSARNLYFIPLICYLHVKCKKPIFHCCCVTVNRRQSLCSSLCNICEVYVVYIGHNYCFERILKCVNCFQTSIPKCPPSSILVPKHLKQSQNVIVLVLDGF